MTKQILITRKARFPLGQIVATPGAIKAITDAEQTSLEFLHRHVTGDLGDVCAFDAAENERAVCEGSRLPSAYRTSKGEKLWIITEHDRTVTTLLLPSEY